jgi:hypothetical protein
MKPSCSLPLHLLLILMLVRALPFFPGFFQALTILFKLLLQASRRAPSCVGFAVLLSSSLADTLRTQRTLLSSIASVVTRAVMRAVTWPWNMSLYRDALIVDWFVIFPFRLSSVC